jgi:hypothetical protein
VPGEVTAASTPSGQSESSPLPWTARFTDAHGTDRWVGRVGVLPIAEVPSAGDTVTVLYDPTAPGDDTSVFVTPARRRRRGLRA